jgi:hypothetical protein
VVEAGSKGLELHLTTPATLRGRLVGPEGEDLPAARLIAWASGPRGYEPVRSAWSAPDESFQIDGLAAGRYDVTAHTGDGRVALLRGVVVEAGGVVEGLLPVLAPGARLRIHYDGTQRYGRFTIFSAGGAVAVHTLHAGTSEVVTVPPGPIEVRFSVAGRLVETRVLETGAGGQAELSFTDG